MNSLLDTLTGRKKREKYVPPTPLIPDTIPTTSQALEPAPQEKETMASTISYNPGSGKADKAFFKLGKAMVPVAVISRIGKAIEGLTPTKASFIIYNKLALKHGGFIEEMDKAEMDYYDATLSMLGMRPVKVASKGVRTSRVSLTAEAMAKSICKRFKGEPQEMMNSFLLVVNGAEFKKEVTDILNSYKNQFGLSTLGYIKTSSRKANPAAMKALEKFRKAKKK